MITVNIVEANIKVYNVHGVKLVFAEFVITEGEM